MKGERPVRVIKRDGTTEPFSFAKLRNCLARVFEETAYERRLAVPLARAVAMHVEDRSAVRPPTTDYLYQCVREALIQTGLREVADALMSHRRLRRARRERVRIFEHASLTGPSVPWRKRDVMVELGASALLGPVVARFLAGEVERQLLDAPARAISRDSLQKKISEQVSAWGLVELPVGKMGESLVAGP